MSDVRPMFTRLRALAGACAIAWSGALPAVASILMADPAGPDQDIYNEGRSLIFDEQWARARAVFETLARRHPGSPFIDDALYWTAFSLYEESKPAAAYQTLRELVTKYADSPWNDDARTLMVRCAEAALQEQGEGGAGRTARPDSGAEYRRFLEESTRDRSVQVSLLAIDTLLKQEPRNAPDLLGRVGASAAGREGAVAVLDRFFGREMVKVTFDEPSAGFAEDNVHVLVREEGQALRLNLSDALDAVRGRGPRSFSESVRSEMAERILEAERSLLTQGESRAAAPHRGGRGRISTIVRVVDGEVHYYNNGAETVRIVVLRRTAGFTPENVQAYVEGAGGIRTIALADVDSGATPAGTAKGISSDAFHYLVQALGVIELDLRSAAR